MSYVILQMGGKRKEKRRLFLTGSSKFQYILKCIQSFVREND